MVSPNYNLIPKIFANAWKSNARAGTTANQKFLFFKRTDQLILFMIFSFQYCNFFLQFVKFDATYYFLKYLIKVSC